MIHAAFRALRVKNRLGKKQKKSAFKAISERARTKKTLTGICIQSIVNSNQS